MPSTIPNPAPALDASLVSPISLLAIAITPAKDAIAITIVQRIANF
jgi:hypothetical protein